MEKADNWFIKKIAEKEGAFEKDMREKR